MSTDSFDRKHEARMAELRQAHEEGFHQDDPEPGCPTCEEEADEA